MQKCSFIPVKIPRRRKTNLRPARGRKGRARKVLSATNPSSSEEKKFSPAIVGGASAISQLSYRPPVFLTEYRVKLFYYEQGLSFSTATPGATSSYFFSANGMFDPNITGTGHQPMGFDQLMLFYEQYTVVTSKITVTTYQSSAAPLRAAVALTPDTTAITDPIRIMENGLIKSTVIGRADVNTVVKSMNLSCNVAKYMGRTMNLRELVNDVTLSGTAAANPTEQVYFTLYAWDPFLGAVAGMYFDAVLEYDAIFWEPRKLTVS
jgi:hypothetical protein